MTLRFTIRPCLSREVSRTIQTTRPLRRCAPASFRAFVAGDTIRRVVFAIDGRELKSTRVADWRGRYWVDVDAAALRPGRHALTASMLFIPESGRKPQVLTLAFRRCASWGKVTVAVSKAVRSAVPVASCHAWSRCSCLVKASSTAARIWSWSRCS